MWLRFFLILAFYFFMLRCIYYWIFPSFLGLKQEQFLEYLDAAFKTYEQWSNFKFFIIVLTFFMWGLAAYFLVIDFQKEKIKKKEWKKSRLKLKIKKKKCSIRQFKQKHHKLKKISGFA